MRANLNLIEGDCMAGVERVEKHKSQGQFEF